MLCRRIRSPIKEIECLPEICIFLNVLQIFSVLAILAIANPFCCCTAGLLDAEPMSLAENPGCCGQSSKTENQPAQPVHDTENCPHQSSKEFQLAYSAKQDVKSVLFEVGQISEPNYLHDVYAVVPSSEIAEWKNPGPSRRAAPPKTSAVYCVYRI